MLSNILLSNILPNIGSNENRSIATNKLLIIFLWTGITLDFFHIHGKVQVLTQLLNIIDKGFTNAESHLFIILMEI